MQAFRSRILAGFAARRAAILSNASRARGCLRHLASAQPRRAKLRVRVLATDEVHDHQRKRCWEAAIRAHALHRMGARERLARDDQRADLFDCRSDRGLGRIEQPREAELGREEAHGGSGVRSA